MDNLLIQIFKVYEIYCLYSAKAMNILILINKT